MIVELPGIDPGSVEVVPRCPNCEEQTFAFGSAVAVVRAEGLARELIHRFKYQRQFYLRRNYQQLAVVADYFDDGDDLVILRKRLNYV